MKTILVKGLNFLKSCFPNLDLMNIGTVNCSSIDLVFEFYNAFMELLESNQSDQLFRKYSIKNFVKLQFYSFQRRS